MTVAAMAEEACGILRGDGVEGWADCFVQRGGCPSSDAAQFGFHFCPGRLNRGQIGRVGGQVAVSKARAVEQRLTCRALWRRRLSITSTASGSLWRSSGRST